MMHRRPADPKLAMHVLTRGVGMGEAAQGAHPGIAIMMFDANGEEHGRSEDGFAWAFRIPGAIEVSTAETTLRNMHALADGFRDWQGNNMFWGSAPLLGEIDDETLVRAWGWWEATFKLHEGFQDGSTVLLEFMQEV